MDPPRARHGHPRLAAPRRPAGARRAPARPSSSPGCRRPVRWPALLSLRSVGIKDLRHGTLVEDDWTGRDLDGPTTGTPHPRAAARRRPALRRPGDAEPAIPDGRLADLLGDLLVPPRSATGDTGDDDRLAFPRRPRAPRSAGCTTSTCSTTRGSTRRSGAGCVDRPEGPRPDRPRGASEASDQALCPHATSPRRCGPLSWTARPSSVSSGGHSMAEQNLLQRLINWRVGAAMEPHPPNETLMRLQQPLVRPAGQVLLPASRSTAGSGSPTGPAWSSACTPAAPSPWTPGRWSTPGTKHFEGERTLHGTAHDVLMASTRPR